jgi:hypothetical protein
MKLTDRQLQVVNILNSTSKPMNGWTIAKRMPPDYERSNIYKVLNSLEQSKIVEQNPQGYLLREGWDKEDPKVKDLTLKFPAQLSSTKSVYEYENPLIHALATILHKTQGESFTNWQKHLIQNLDYDRIITDYIEMTLIFQILLENRAYFPVQTIPDRAPDPEETLTTLADKYFRSE